MTLIKGGSSVDFGTMIKGFQKGFKKISQHDLILDVFESAVEDIWGVNRSLPIARAAAAKWINGKNEGYVSYFEGKDFNDDGFINFLKTRTGPRWMSIRDEFKNLKNVEIQFINCETSNIDVFLRGVLQEFKYIVGGLYKINVGEKDESKSQLDTDTALESTFSLPDGFVDSVFDLGKEINLEQEFALCLNNKELDSKFTYWGRKVAEQYISMIHSLDYKI